MKKHDKFGEEIVNHTKSNIDDWDRWFDGSATIKKDSVNGVVITETVKNKGGDDVAR